MPMDFFQSQETARKRTWVLVVLYAIAVLTTMGLAYVAVSIAVSVYKLKTERYFVYQHTSGLFSPDVFWIVAGGTLAVVVVGTLYKFAEMSSGGVAVAKALGGRPLDPNTKDPVDRKVLNVVEEMSVASGIPVPQVFLLDRERGINAFAAGFSPSRSVIGITGGAAEYLSRDQLQGVVAHEFSHILNGDSGLNLKLLCTLNGILVIGLLGSMIMRLSLYGSSGSSRRRGDSSLYIIVVGMALFVIGYLGFFFGKLIKAAVSRQRELLADASAVQFTRNPDGIAGALKEIGGSTRGSKLRAHRAEEFSHMFFGCGLGALRGLLATHPPLPVRIKRIEPDWDGTYPEPVERTHAEEAAPAAAKTAGAPGIAARPVGAILGAAAAGTVGAIGAAAGSAPASAIDHIGRPTLAHLDYAKDLLKKVPEDLRDHLKSSLGARALFFAMILDEDQEATKKQWDHIASAMPKTLSDRIAEVKKQLADVGQEAWLPLLDVAIPALRQLTLGEYEDFKKSVETLVMADEKVDALEWVLHHVLLRDLEPSFVKVPKPAVQYYNLKNLHGECALLLSVLARAGAEEESEIFSAYRSGAERLGLEENLVPEGEADLAALDDVLTKIAAVTPKLKQAVLNACAATIAWDDKITIREGELFRGIAAALDCPVPPLLPGQPLK